MAAKATFALKAGVWFRRGRLCMVSPDSQATACLPSGRNSTYRPVQISGASSQAYIVKADMSGNRVSSAVMGLVAGGKDFEIVTKMCAKYGLDPRNAS